VKELLRKIQAALTATAFAEEGEVETARRIMAEAGIGRRFPRRRGANSLEAAMAAAAFAEEGEAETARRLLDGSPPPRRAEPKSRPAEAPPDSRPIRPRSAG
jgi:hypothetical protein